MFKFIFNNIPNSITIINSFLGFSSILASFQAIINFYLSSKDLSTGNSSTYLALAGVLIIVSAFFDFFDGVIARLLNVSSKIGKEMDSLADLVSFGIAPGVLFFTITMIAGNYIPGTDIFYRIDRVIPNSLLPHLWVLKVLAFVFPTCVIIRLARFNIKTDHSKPTLYYEGIASTFGGGFVALIFTFNFIESPVVYVLSLFDVKWQLIEDLNSYFHPFFHDYFFLLIIYLFISFMMITRIPYRKINIFLKVMAKKKYFLLNIIVLFLFLLFFRYAALIGMIAYLIFGVKRPIKKKLLIE